LTVDLIYPRFRPNTYWQDSITFFDNDCFKGDTYGLFGNYYVSGTIAQIVGEGDFSVISSGPTTFSPVTGDPTSGGPVVGKFHQVKYAASIVPPPFAADQWNWTVELFVIGGSPYLLPPSVLKFQEPPAPNLPATMTIDAGFTLPSNLVWQRDNNNNIMAKVSADCRDLNGNEIGFSLHAEKIVGITHPYNFAPKFPPDVSVTKTVASPFVVTVTLTNESCCVITGPIQVVFSSLTPGLTLAHPTGEFLGSPFITVPGVTNLGPGQVTSIDVQLNNPSNVPIDFTSVIISGSPCLACLTLPPHILTTASGLAYSRVSQTFNGRVTLTNTGTAAINGPFQIFFTSLTSGTTLSNAAGVFLDSPVITVPALTGLAPGQSATVDVQFSNPSAQRIKFTPVVYSGEL
jgi:hypothetical protein